ncbi:hypothetical protein [Azorhizobium caulinodans]|nr:hypothetical protein [Azorhizobium caulinodans]
MSRDPVLSRLGRSFALRRGAQTLLTIGSVALGVVTASAQTAEEAADTAILAAYAHDKAELGRLDADPAQTDATYAFEARARADLRQRLIARLGPLSFSGFKAEPAFSPESLFPDTWTFAYGSPPGLLFEDEEGTRRIFVTSAALFADWLAGAAKAKDAPPEFGRGTTVALTTDAVAASVILDPDAFLGFGPLPLAAAPGETLLALYGQLAPDVGHDGQPNAVLIARLTDDRFMAAAAYLGPGEMAPLPACQSAYDQTARTGQGADPAERRRILLRAEDAFRQCVGREAPRQPAFRKMVARAQALLDTMRGR